jgi:NADPH:quinone reductase-like Zn-dependent oxidoreductase
MTAVVQDAYGAEPEQVLRIGEVPRPVPGRGEVLVRVQAASVDAGVWHLMSGMPLAVRAAGYGLRRPKLLNPGRGVAGVVEEVGPGATGLAPGDAVYGPAAAGFAGLAVARADRLAPRPAGLSFVQAAAVPVSGLTALQAVRDHGRVQAGQQVLVIGASGGVGSFAVQLAAAFGGHVTGMAGPAKLDLVRSLGPWHRAGGSSSPAA